MKYPLISVIIVTYNSDSYLSQCIDSIFKVTYKHLEIILIDNNSQDKTKDIIKSFHTRIDYVFLGTNLGYAEANNIGIKKSKGDFVFLLNPDTIVDKNIFENLLKAFQHNSKIAVGQPAVFLMKNPHRLNLTGKVTHYLGFDWVRDYKGSICPGEGEIMSFSGCGVMIKKSVLKITSAFDQSYFMYFEDSDLSWRLRLFGYKFMFIPSAIMYHDYKYIPVEGYQTLKNKLFYNERNRIITIIKNYSVKTIVVLLPIIILLEFCMLLFALLNGWVIEKIKGYISILTLRKKIFKNRLFVQKNRILSDKEVTQYFVSTLNIELYNNIAVRLFINPIVSGYWLLIKNVI